jgi:tyrosyl-tRNA synthetase
MFHPSSEGIKARSHFENTFSQHQIPENIPEHKIIAGEKLIDILAVTKIVATKNEARRLIMEGAVTHGSTVISDVNWVVEPGILKIGKRRFLRVV